MPRWVIPLLFVLSLAAVLAGLFWPDPGPTGGSGPGPAASTATFLEDWDSSHLTLVLSAAQHGYLEPCGCSETQSGGYSRRADLLDQMRTRGFQPVNLDLGGLVRRRREQSRIKYEAMLSALGDMQYAVVGVGPEDLALGPDFLLTQGPSDDDDTARPPLLSANIRLFDSDDLPGAPISTRVITVGNRQVGITAILDPSLSEPLEAAGVLADVSLQPPEEILPNVLTSLTEQGADILILLAQASLKRSIELARRFPQFHLVVTAGGPEDPLTDNPQKIGETTLVSVGQKGKYVGVVSFGVDVRSPRFELVNLDNERFEDHPSMTRVMRAYQQTLEQLDLAAAMLPIDTSGNRRFVGSARCGECHTQALAKWQQTGHAHALESLVTGRAGQEDNWVPRIFDAECLSCHVTGWDPQRVIPFKSGYVDQATSAHLRGNGCENCHGPGSRHVELIEKGQVQESLREVRLTLETARRSTCGTCHDLDNSPQFDFDTYWPRIAHPGRD